MPMDFYAAADKTGEVPTEPIDFGSDYFGVKHMENARIKLQGLGKAWDVGSQLTVFYPFRLVPSREEDGKLVWVPCMSAVWGHKVNDAKLLKRSFLRSRCQMNSNGEVIGDGDLAYQFSRIASLLVRAQKEAELAACAERDWSALGQSAYQTARQAIEDKYDPKKLKGVKPLLGRLTIQCTTCVYAVAMDPNTSTPILDPGQESKTKTGMFSQILSQSRKDKLFSLANNALHGIYAQHPGKEYAVGDVAFLEVLYNFTSARMEKSEAGQADPQGVAQSVSILFRAPDLAPKVEQRLSSVPVTSDDIRAKLYAMDPMRDEDLLKALQQYTFDTAPNWHLLPSEEKGRLLDAANLIDYLRIKPANEGLRDEFAQRLGHPIGEAPAGSAPTIDGLVGSDDKFDVTTQSDAVNNVLRQAEQGDIPVEDDAGVFGGLAEDMEV